MTVNVLLSYAYHEKTDLAEVRRELVCGRMMIDSGAFTAHTTGKVIRLDEYAEFLERGRGSWDHAVTLDVIGDHAGTARNTRALHERGLPVMPVFTRGGHLNDFDAMVRDCQYVCVGGLVGLPKQAVKTRVGLLQRRARELGGGIHALGIGSMDILRETRPYSADSSTVAQVDRFGSVLCFDGRNLSTVNLNDRAKLKRALPHLTSLGYEIAPAIKARRLPGGEEMKTIRRGGYVAFACAAEALTQYEVPPPGGAGDPGTHLYTAIEAGWPLHRAHEADQLIHSSSAPPAWQRYGRHHTCARKAPTDAP